MMKKKFLLLALCVSMVMPSTAVLADGTTISGASVLADEQLDRGVAAVPVDGGIYLSWRLGSDEDNVFGTANANTTFDIYRDGEKIATESDTTNYIDKDGTKNSVYAVVPSGESLDNLKTGIKSVEGRKITLNAADTSSKVYAAKYNGDILEKIQVFDITQRGYNEFTADFDVDRAFLWNDMTPVQDGMEDASVMLSDGGYLSIPLDKPAAMTLADGNTYSYTANDASCGDVDGDGEYEIILKWDCNGQDNSLGGYTGNVLLDAYKLDGTKLWRVDLGQNIRAGAHYTQFLVYDFDGDGKAEISCKTAPGSMDSSGEYVTKASHDDKIAAVTDEVNQTNYVNTDGKILDGAEYYTVFDGKGRAVDTIEYPFLRGKIADWGKNDGGNRVDRFLGTVAYLDGINPYIISVRGYYAKTTVAAMRLNDGKLSVEKTFTTDNSQYKAYLGQGNHNITAADVDGDGKDEVITGSICWDDDLSLKWCSGRGHGDALHIGDYDPTHDGLEYFSVHESGDYEITASTTSSQGQQADYGMTVYDAATGEELYHRSNSKDTGRGMMANIGSGGYYQIAGSANVTAEGDGVFTDKNVVLGTNFRIFWDGDLYDEMLNSTNISDWNGSGMTNIFTAEGCVSVNGTKANPSLQADLFGDWREEVVYPTEDSTALRIYMTTDKTDYKMKSLMYDGVYRKGVAAEQTAYNQPPHISYYLSEDSFYGTLEDIELDTANVKTTYYIGEEFDKSGLKVIGKYSGKDDREVTGYSISGYDPMTKGEQTITVKYMSKSKTYTVNVIGESDISADNTKNTYKVGETLDKSAITVKIQYEDGTERTISSFKVTGYDALATGEQTITVSYEGMEGTYSKSLTVNVVSGLVIENGVVTGFGGTDTEIVIPSAVISAGEVSNVLSVADEAFAQSQLEKVYVYGKDIEFNGDNIFPDGVTIVCTEDSKAYEYATAHNINVEIIKTGDAVTFDEDFYSAYAGKNMLMQGASELSLKDEFITYNLHAADSRAPWYKADTYGFKIASGADGNYLNVNAGIYDSMNQFNQVYITLNNPKPVSENQTVAFDIRFPSGSGSPYVEIQNDAGTIIDTVSASAQSLSADTWYRYELAFKDGEYTGSIYDMDGEEVKTYAISQKDGNTIVSSIVFKQDFVMSSSGGITGIAEIDNILLN